MPRTVFRFSGPGGGDDQIPAGIPTGGYLDHTAWFEEQNLGDPNWVNEISVVQLDERVSGCPSRHRLMAYIERYATARPELVGGKTWLLPDGQGRVGRYLQHHEVTSIKLLLDQFSPARSYEEVEA